MIATPAPLAKMWCGCGDQSAARRGAEAGAIAMPGPRHDAIALEGVEAVQFRASAASRAGRGRGLQAGGRSRSTHAQHGLRPPEVVSVEHLVDVLGLAGEERRACPGAGGRGRRPGQGRPRGECGGAECRRGRA
jgi:hypothetical protein